MKKRIFLFTLVLSILMCVFAISAFAGDIITVDNIKYEITSSSTVNFNADDPTEDTTLGTLIIPETITYDGVDYTVTGVTRGRSWPDDNEYINSVIKVELPATVNSVPEHIFRNYKGLQEVKFLGNISSFNNAEFYQCTALTKVELPELDDDFAKDVSEFDTFAEYKADVKAKIEKRHETAAENAVEDKLVEALIEKLEADIPEPMFVAETENFVRDYDTRLRSQGLDLNTYFKYTGMTLDALREQMRPQAERQVKARLALEKIAVLENLEATEEDINSEYEKIANAYGIELEQVKASIDSEAIAADMKVQKAMELVKEKAVVTVK